MKLIKSASLKTPKSPANIGGKTGVGGGHTVFIFRELYAGTRVGNCNNLNKNLNSK